MEIRPTIDASALPASAFDARAPVWWGNALFLTIETVTLALLTASYFYVRQNYEDWPPPRVNDTPPIKHPVPGLLAGTINTLLLVTSCAPTIWIDRAARRQQAVRVKVGLAALSALGVVMIGMRILEFQAVKFRWDDNAYASIVWALLGLHLFYLVSVVIETMVVGVWTALHGLDEKHAVDVTLTAGTWYWTAGVWVWLYAVIYWAPRIL